MLDESNVELQIVFNDPDLDSEEREEEAQKLLNQLRQLVEVEAQLGGEGRAVLTSSSSTQYSFERKGSDLSIYTKFRKKLMILLVKSYRSFKKL